MMDPSNKSSEYGNENKTFSNYETVNIWLDSLDELFSDFDPRTYSKRTVSDDFIAQIRKVIADRKGENLILQLQLPEKTRNKQDETIIAKRLQFHFKKKYEELLKEKKNGIRNAIILTLSGIALMIISSYINYFEVEKYRFHLLLVIFEPGGWFCLWTGLDRLIDYAGKRKKELNFYSKMFNTPIQFSTI